MANEDIARPAHYAKTKFQPINMIEQVGAGSGFNWGNVLKYVCRAPYKGTEKQDLIKAQMYLTWYTNEDEHHFYFEPLECDYITYAERLGYPEASTGRAKDYHDLVAGLIYHVIQGTGLSHLAQLMIILKRLEETV